jgi:E3 ubiquitin-protein ligase CCNP1IP1
MKLTDLYFSHIFCIACSNSLGLSNPNFQVRVCPACETSLQAPDDAVSTDLNPSEDYKTSVLSGLSPGTIMECAGRGLAFWSYQTTQEMWVISALDTEYPQTPQANSTSVYQEYLAKNLADKYNTLNSQMDKVIHDANAEISGLRSKLSGLLYDILS